MSALTMNPSPVKTTGTISFSLSAPAAVTVRILTTQGALLRELVSGSLRPSGTTTVAWDRKDSAGRRVVKGTYRVQVQAVDAGGQSAPATATFAVA